MDRQRVGAQTQHAPVLATAAGTHPESKAELSGGLDHLLEVDAMVELILIKLHQQLQVLGTLRGRKEGGMSG